MPATLMKPGTVGRTDDEVVGVGHRPQRRRTRRCSRPGVIAGHEPLHRGEDLGGAPSARGGQVVAVLDVLGGGADHDRAVVGGDDQDALRGRGRAGEDEALHEPVEALVEQVLLALAARWIGTSRARPWRRCGPRTRPAALTTNAGRTRRSRRASARSPSTAAIRPTGASSMRSTPLSAASLDQREAGLVGIDHAGGRGVQGAERIRVRLGSSRRRRSASHSSRPGTPRSRPCWRRSSRVSSSSGSKATVRSPTRWKLMPSSAASGPHSWFPDHSSGPFTVPDGEWWPAWMMPLLALEVPNPTSVSLSIRPTRTSWRLRWRAMAQPMTPAPTMATSNSGAVPVTSTVSDVPEALRPWAHDLSRSSAGGES